MSDENNAARMFELRDRAEALHELLELAAVHEHNLPAVGRLLAATLLDAERLAAELVGGQAEAEA